MLLLCLAILASDLVTAPGSFRLNGFPVWDNATVWSGSMVETDKVALTIHLASGQTLVVAPKSQARLADGTITVERGLARLERKGAWTLRAKAIRTAEDGKVIGADLESELKNADNIWEKNSKIHELRPGSQRP